MTPTSETTLDDATAPAAAPAAAETEAVATEAVAAEAAEPRWKIVLEAIFGDAPDHCIAVTPETRVAFGKPGWLAQHRWIESVVGVVGLLLTFPLCVLGFQVLPAPAAWGLVAFWGALIALGVALRTRRPCTVMRLPAHALFVWVAVVVGFGLLAS